MSECDDVDMAGGGALSDKREKAHVWVLCVRVEVIRRLIQRSEERRVIFCQAPFAVVRGDSVSCR